MAAGTGRQDPPERAQGPRWAVGRLEPAEALSGRATRSAAPAAKGRAAPSR
jgi:hypothetical protein